MKRLAFVSFLLGGVLEAPACSAAEYLFRYDTLETGAVRVLRSGGMAFQPDPWSRADTLGVYRPADLEARLRGFLQDSALVFIGRFDSLWRDTIPPAPMVALDTTPSNASHTAYFRLQVDTVLRGVFPHPRPVWVRVREGFASCTIPFGTYVGKPFLNASSGFSVRSNLKMTFDPFAGYATHLSLANWFTGRYLYDPAFPKVMRFDITKILTEYPATGIAPRRPPGRVPAAPAGKTWLPDGRAAGGRDARANPVPILR